MDLEKLYKLHIKDQELSLNESEVLELYSLLSGILNPKTKLTEYPIFPSYPMPSSPLTPGDTWPNPIWIVDPNSQPWYCTVSSRGVQ